MQSKQLFEAAGQEVLDQKNNWEPKGNGKDGFPFWPLLGIFEDTSTPSSAPFSFEIAHNKKACLGNTLV
ncbi:MAG: hypothetical protein JJ848_009535 [Prochlorococcus marinus CUG1439]|uniref:hypothetical protein n=1 Tax=Prochlorococcus sp. MIT 1314 TaxID=3096220 RepID=UPI001B1852C2|nr:hypothetical protein [Prochlorococcus sp. MIT 1314]MCR8540578.1 hypothetical protein [Prochlorococcus marinus CUG1439]